MTSDRSTENLSAGVDPAEVEEPTEAAHLRIELVPVPVSGTERARWATSGFLGRLLLLVRRSEGGRRGRLH